MSKPRDSLPLAASGALVALGLPGLLSLLLVLPAIQGAPRPLLLVNPLVWLTLAGLVGGWAAPRVGLRSRLASRIDTGAGPWIPPDVGRFLLGGVVCGVAVASLDHFTRAVWQAPGGPASLVEAWHPSALVVGLFYGGVVEEIVFRWGLVSALAWAFLRPTAARRGALVGALACAAVAFALAHLPALAPDGGPLALAVWIRTVGLNTAIGLVLGSIFVRRDLESAIVAHAALHLGFALTALAASA